MGRGVSNKYISSFSSLGAGICSPCFFQELNPVTFDAYKKWVSYLFSYLSHFSYRISIWQICFLTETGYLLCSRSDVTLWNLSYSSLLSLQTRPLESSASNFYLALQSPRGLSPFLGCLLLLPWVFSKALSLLAFPFLLKETNLLMLSTLLFTFPLPWIYFPQPLSSWLTRQVSAHMLSPQSSLHWTGDPTSLPSN